MHEFVTWMWKFKIPQSFRQREDSWGVYYYFLQQSENKKLQEQFIRSAISNISKQDSENWPRKARRKCMTAAWRTSNSTSLMKHTQVIVSGRGLQMLFIFWGIHLQKSGSFNSSAWLNMSWQDRTVYQHNGNRSKTKPWNCLIDHTTENNPVLTLWRFSPLVSTDLIQKWKIATWLILPVAYACLKD